MSSTHPVMLAVPAEPSDHTQGPEHARVVVMEYGDFECPSCKVAATTPALLMERYPNHVRFIFRISQRRRRILMRCWRRSARRPRRGRESSGRCTMCCSATKLT